MSHVYSGTLEPETTVTQAVRSTERGAWLRKARTSSSRFLNRTVTMKWVMIGTLVLSIGSFVIWRQFGVVQAAARASDRAAAAQQLYQAQVTQYTAASNAYQLCIDSVGRSDINRAQWAQFGDKLVEQWAKLAALVADNPEGAALIAGIGVDQADFIRTGPLLSSEPRTIEQCGPMPVPPSPPN